MPVHMPIGTKRVCRECSQEYEHFGKGSLLCPACHAIRDHEYNITVRRTPERKASENRAAMKRYHGNKEAVLSFLKTCRCEQCREADPRILRFWRKDGTHANITNGLRYKLSIKAIQRLIADCRVLCLNCRARDPKPFHVSTMRAYIA